MKLLGGLIGGAVKPVVDGVVDTVEARERTKQITELAMAWAQVASAAWRPWLAKSLGWTIIAYVVASFLLAIVTMVGIVGYQDWANLSSMESPLAALMHNWIALGSEVFRFSALFLTTYAGSRGLEKMTGNATSKLGRAIGSVARVVTGNDKPEPVVTVTEEILPATVQRMDGINMPDLSPAKSKAEQRQAARSILERYSAVPPRPMRFDMKLFLAELLSDEDRVFAIYADSKGHRTAGVGHLLVPADKEHDWPMHSQVSADRVQEWLNHDSVEAVSAARSSVDEFDTLPMDARLVLANMAFQMGGAGLRGFKRMLAHINAGQWTQAADEALDSDWYRTDTPGRAMRMSERLRALHTDITLA